MRICIAIDDFGLHDGVNIAALRLAEKGRIHAIGCMVGGDAWRGEWLDRMRGLARDGVDVGLHLDFTERPLLAGTRRPLPLLIAQAWLQQLDLAAVRSEVRAQLDAFENALGFAPAFIDGHQHVHQFEGVRQMLLAEVDSRYRTQPPWLRSTRTARGHRQPLKAQLIEALGNAATLAAAARLGLRHNRCLLGVYDFKGGATRYRTLFAGWLAQALDGDLLMCHVASGTPHGAAADALIAARRAECEVLDSLEFDALISDAGLQLAPMSRILAQPPAQS